MVLYRITRCVYANDLSGTGARLFGGRWNGIGRSALYLASSCALAVLEVLVHLPPLLIPEEYCLVEIEVPDNSITIISASGLPANWKEISPPDGLQLIGNEFIEKAENLLMRVPSSIVPMEYNYILNPLHPLSSEVKILGKQPFDFDERLIKS